MDNLIKLISYHPPNNRLFDIVKDLKLILNFLMLNRPKKIKKAKIKVMSIMSKLWRKSLPNKTGRLYVIIDGLG